MCAQHRAILPPTGSQWEGTQNGCHRNRLAQRRPGGLPHRRGGPVEDRNVDDTPAGHRRLIDWAHRGRAGRVAIEGSGNDGRPAALALLAAGIEVVEVPPQMTAQARRRQRSNTKTGRVDALLVARVGARDDDVAPARRDGQLDELRCLVGYRRELVKSRTGASTASTATSRRSAAATAGSSAPSPPMRPSGA